MRFVGGMACCLPAASKVVAVVTAACESQLAAATARIVQRYPSWVVSGSRPTKIIIVQSLNFWIQKDFLRRKWQQSLLYRHQDACIAHPVAPLCFSKFYLLVSLCEPLAPPACSLRPVWRLSSGITVKVFQSSYGQLQALLASDSWLAPPMVAHTRLTPALPICVSNPHVICTAQHQVLVACCGCSTPSQQPPRD